MYTFSTPLSKLTIIKPPLAKKLAAVGLSTVGDLLYNFPFRYEDYSVHKTISELVPGETVTIRGQIKEIKTARSWKRRMMITEAWIFDGIAITKAVWFNAPGPVRFLGKGKFVQLSGKVNVDKKNLPFFQHPNFELLSKEQYIASELTDQNAAVSDKAVNTGILAPVYSETKDITSYFLRRLVKAVLSKTKIEEIIPQDILRDQQLIGLAEALSMVHFPQSLAEAEEAKRRFAFEKMLLMQLKSLQVKHDWDQNNAVPIPFDEPYIKKFVTTLPFTLTGAQKKSAWQIIKDLEQPKPMNRLLEGDVGSGKTVVAAMTILSVIHKKFQAALLAPTEVLSVQHYEGLETLFSKYNFSSALLTGSQARINGTKVKRKELLERLANGTIDYIIGTHALLTQGVTFMRLALIIIDEQHRFGVNQRAHLQQAALSVADGKKKTIPHLLTMTATPIPRTLSIAIFGNLDLSIIDEFPKGRKKIITKVIPPHGREVVYDFIRAEIEQGRQAFVICPLVEESSKVSEVKAATEEFKRLQHDVFPNVSLGLLHGKMRPKEKETVMQDFKAKKFDILVSTSVVEVGVDVPNATIMIIEGAERFGLSQLHQFRGRVGRAEHQSYCFFFTTESGPESTSRLKVMERTNDGFVIAQEDLKLRGPGQFLGTLQSGVPDIAMESLSDVKLIQASRLQAQRILSFDPKLEKFPLLKNHVQQMRTAVHWE